MASPGRGRPLVEGSGRRNATSANPNGSDRAVAPGQQPARSVVWGVLGRAAGTAWAGIKLCHRYVLAPAAIWVLQNLKAYIEEQLAIQSAMTRPCPVPSYSESEVRQATDELSFTRRALGTPYGMVVYLTRLRGAPVAVRQVLLSRLQDVDAFWEEAAAGRALLSTGRNAHVVPYVGCCPALACHVYEQRPGVGSLREVLLPGSPYGSALGSWEIRVTLCRQMISAAVHLLQAGICARELSAAHIMFSLGEGDCRGGGDPGCAGASGSGSGSSGPADRGPRCWLAPGCEFRLKAEPAQPPAAAAAARQSQPPPPPPPPRPQSFSWAERAAAAQRCSGGSGGQRRSGGQRPSSGGDTAGPGAGAEAGGGVEEAFVAMGRALGQVLFQLVAGADSAVPPPSVVLSALADMAPTRLLSPSVTSAVAPPLTEDQAWPLIAVVYSLLSFGGGDGGGAGEPSAAAGRSWPGRERLRAAGRGAGAASGSGDAGGTGGAAGSGPASKRGRELLRLLVQEVMPVMEDVQSQVRGAAQPPPPTVAAAAGASAPAARARPGPRTPPPAPSPPPPPQEDAFAGASAPPLPEHLPPPPAPASASARPTAPASSLPPAAPARAVPAPSSASVPAPPSPALFPGPAAVAAAAPGGGGGGGAVRQGPPEELLCPITQDLIEDPVVAADGHSYERAAITRWFAARRGGATSPLTGAALPHTHLTPNYALRKIIGDWREAHGA